MKADTAANTSDKNAATEVPKAPAITNRLFLSNIDYKNYDETGDVDLSPDEVRQRLEELFSKFGSVLEIYLADKDNPNIIKNKQQARLSFGFVAMETAMEAQAALDELGPQQQQSEEIGSNQDSALDVSI